ncbi:fibronectin type III domain-containing protein [Rathayibacter tritici]|uniref:Fibronectin type-III domain-containing protein n=1 Tax=Rathayibacter tritici TaxID=33888 RepID=A0A160KVH0_9MICO|nr:hypothetical protein A6122_2575 [Rathayibacter tritici]PPI49141.1 fibronectin type III domain-containing protein [Rathayibacter tritici]
MRTKTLSVWLLLALLLSFFVATPAQAAGSPAAPTNVVALQDGCSDSITVSWDAPQQFVAGYRVHVYEKSYFHPEYYLYQTFTMALSEVRGGTSATIAVRDSSSPIGVEVVSVTDFSSPFEGGKESELLVPSDTQSPAATADVERSASAASPSNLTIAVDTNTALASARWTAPSVNGLVCTFDEYHATTDYTYGPNEDYDDYRGYDAVYAADSTSQNLALERNRGYEFCVWSSSAIHGYREQLTRLDSPKTCVKFTTGTSAPYSPGGIYSSASGNSITITWTDPASDGGTDITGYRVARTGTDASGSGPWSTVVAADRRSQTFTNLRPNTSYTFAVQAINAVGSSLPATATEVANPYSAPSVPTGVTGSTNDTARTATIAWAPPVSAGNPGITGYRVSRNGVDNAGSGPWSTVVTGSTRSFTFTNLAPSGTDTLTVAAVNAGGESPTGATVVALRGTALTAATPTITGTAKVGSTLTANAGTWGPSPVALAYQWRANGSAISGATGRTYRPVPADAGTVITVAVAGSQSGYVSTTRVSSGTAAVTAGTLTSATPTITGTAKVGSTLTAKPGTWGPSPVTLAYQWKANGTALSGATAATYTPTSATIGKAITVAVTGSKSGYAGASKTSAATGAVVAGTLSAATPSVTGTAKVGSTLTAKPGTWGPSPVTLTYQWKANGTALSGATAATYRPTSATVGKTITVTVTGKKTGYATATRSSAATAAVAT